MRVPRKHTCLLKKSGTGTWFLEDDPLLLKNMAREFEGTTNTFGK